MKKQISCISQHSIEFFTTSYNRCRTPSFMRSNKVILPTMTDENLRVAKRSDKKYSILNVPKRIHRESSIFKENNTEIREESPKYPELVETIQKSSICKSGKISLAKICKIRRSYRPNIKPNEDLLKTEFLKMKLEHNNIETKSCSQVRKQSKSDIEKILESQEFHKFHKKKEKPSQILIGTQPNISFPEEPIQSESEESEMAYQKENKPPKVQSSNRMKLKQPPHDKKMPSLSILLETKTGKEILEKILESKSRMVKSTYVRNEKFLDSIDKDLLDYKQESLRVLKNTAFFARRIMKGNKFANKSSAINL